MSEPDYLYEYEETYIKCRYCKDKVEVQNIDYDDYESICPECGYYGTFPKIKYEKIEDVIKSKQL
jgi:Zn finger protein HypA/HybF involved in hydrogenase expression